MSKKIKILNLAVSQDQFNAVLNPPSKIIINLTFNHKIKRLFAQPLTRAEYDLIKIRTSTDKSTQVETFTIFNGYTISECEEYATIFTGDIINEKELKALSL